jgi:hypothetical protein
MHQGVGFGFSFSSTYPQTIRMGHNLSCTFEEDCGWSLHEAAVLPTSRYPCPQAADTRA